MKYKYTFSVLRYVHDVTTEEFINVGVALYAPDAKFVDAMCVNKYGRLSKTFHGVDGEHFKQVVAFIEKKFHEKKEILNNEFTFDRKKTISGVLSEVLPIDDSSLRFSSEGSGLSEKPQATLANLYVRYCEKYMEKVSHRRDEEDVWRLFKKPLEDRGIVDKLKSITVKSSDDELEFKHAWKNAAWHVLQPVSFDLIESQSIMNKANLWLGRGYSVLNADNMKKNYKEGVKISFLLGAPEDQKLKKYFIKAQNILHKIPCEKDFINESDAEKYAEHVKKELSHLNS